MRTHWPAYVAKFGRLIPEEQRAAVRAILRCRTPALGGQRYRCACGREHFAYHSCNHRACPRCGQDDAAAWLAQQRTRLLPVPYFLVTFTVPEELREPIRQAMQPWYGALLKEGAGALQDLAADPKHLGAELGLTAMLQTWTRDLRYHPHVHLLVPGGGLTPNRLRWMRVKNPEFLVPQAKLAARFKGRLKVWLKAHEPELFKEVPDKVWWLNWVADVQAVGGGEAALQYLARYLCKPPLHESQIEQWDAAGVTFRYRENGGTLKRCTVSGTGVRAAVPATRPAQGVSTRAPLRLARGGGPGQVGTHPGPAGLEKSGAGDARALAPAPMSGLWQDDVPDRHAAAGAHLKGGGR